MDMFEKVEKIREKANVSYEEARDALERSGGDILDAMIILEREGKTKKPEQESYSTGGRGSGNPKKESAKNNNCCGKDEKPKGESFCDKVKNLFRKSMVNYLVIESKNEQVVKLPILIMMLILIFAWYVAMVAVIVSLFLGCKYSFEGEDNMKTANDACEKVGEVVSDIVDAPESKASDSGETPESSDT